MSSILDLSEPRQDTDDPHGLRILPYVIVETLEQMAEYGTFPNEYKSYLFAVAKRICEANN